MEVTFFKTICSINGQTQVAVTSQMDPTFKVGDVPLINKIQPSWPNIQNIPEYSNSQNMLNCSSKIPAGAGGIVMKYPWTVYLNYRRTTMVQTTSTKVCPEALNPTSCLFIRFPCVVSFRMLPLFSPFVNHPCKNWSNLEFFFWGAHRKILECTKRKGSNGKYPVAFKSFLRAPER